MPRFFAVILLVVFCFPFAFAQSQTATSPQASAVPQLVNFSGVASDGNGKPLSGMVGITFTIYQEQQGGSPLWMETQNVSLSAGGRYTVTLGATKSSGIPVEMFASGQARWIGVQVQGQAERPRVLLGAGRTFAARNRCQTATVQCAATTSRVSRRRLVIA